MAYEGIWRPFDNYINCGALSQLNNMQMYQEWRRQYLSFYLFLFLFEHRTKSSSSASEAKLPMNNKYKKAYIKNHIKRRFELTVFIILCLTGARQSNRKLALPSCLYRVVIIIINRFDWLGCGKLMHSQPPTPIQLMKSYYIMRRTVAMKNILLSHLLFACTNINTHT